MKQMAIDNAENKIKKCPFCDNNDLRIETRYMDTYFVRCDSCQTLGPDKKTEPEAIRAWNKAPRKRKTGRLEKLDKLYLSNGEYFKIESSFDYGLEVYYLRPCPKCAERKAVINHEATKLMYYIVCQNCGESTTMRKHKSDAVVEWNRPADEEGKNAIHIETKNCPFCASGACLSESFPAVGHYEYRIECKHCGAKGPNDINISRAWEMWNMRREKMPNE